MIPNLLTWCLCLAVLVIVFIGGLQVGREMEKDAARQRRQGRRVTLQDITGADPNPGHPQRPATFGWCPTCGAGPGRDCIPQGRRRVPTQRGPQ